MVSFSLETNNKREETTVLHNIHQMAVVFPPVLTLHSGTK